MVSKKPIVPLIILSRLLVLVDCLMGELFFCRFLVILFLFFTEGIGR